MAGTYWERKNIHACTLTKGVLAANRNGFKIGQESDCTEKNEKR